MVGLVKSVKEFAAIPQGFVNLFLTQWIVELVSGGPFLRKLLYDSRSFSAWAHLSFALMIKYLIPSRFKESSQDFLSPY